MCGRKHKLAVLANLYCSLRHKLAGFRLEKLAALKGFNHLWAENGNSAGCGQLMLPLPQK